MTIVPLLFEILSTKSLCFHRWQVLAVIVLASLSLRGVEQGQGAVGEITALQQSFAQELARGDMQCARAFYGRNANFLAVNKGLLVEYKERRAYIQLFLDLAEASAEAKDEPAVSAFLREVNSQYVKWNGAVTNDEAEGLKFEVGLWAAQSLTYSLLGSYSTSVELAISARNEVDRMAGKLDQPQSPKGRAIQWSGHAVMSALGRFAMTDTLVTYAKLHWKTYTVKSFYPDDLAMIWLVLSQDGRDPLSMKMLNEVSAEMEVRYKELNASVDYPKRRSSKVFILLSEVRAAAPRDAVRVGCSRIASGLKNGRIDSSGLYCLWFLREYATKHGLSTEDCAKLLVETVPPGRESDAIRNSEIYYRLTLDDALSSTPGETAIGQVDIDRYLSFYRAFLRDSSFLRRWNESPKAQISLPEPLLLTP